MHIFINITFVLKQNITEDLYGSHSGENCIITTAKLQYFIEFHKVMIDFD